MAPSGFRISYGRSFSPEFSNDMLGILIFRGQSTRSTTDTTKKLFVQVGNRLPFSEHSEISVDV
jgi:hypothetical protein